MDNGASSYRRYLDGDQTAFDDIIKALFDPLVFFIERYVGDFHSAEDIAMDVFAYLIAYPKKYNFKCTLKTYLFMLGKSRALNYLKHNRIITQTAIDECGEIADRAHDVEAAVIKKEEYIKLNLALKDLPGEMAAAIHLIYFEEMTYSEAARVMKKTVKQVDNLLYGAKSRLRNILGKDGETLL